MAGEQTVSGHITWKQQAGSVLQQRKIFRSSPTTRRSHFIWPGGCGHRIDTFPTVRAGYAVVHLSAAPSHIFFHFMSSLSLPWQTWHLSSSVPFPTFPPTSSSFSPQLPPLLSLPLPPVLSVFPPQQPYLIKFPSHVSPRSHLPLQTRSFLPLSPPFSLCLWSVTLNLAPSICFSSLV